MGEEKLGLLRQVLEVFAQYEIPVEQIPSGVDSETLYTLIRRIKPVIEQNSNLMIESERGKSYRLIIR